MQLRRGRGSGLFLRGLRLGLRPQRLQARALALLDLAALLGRLQRAPTRVELVTGETARPLHHLGQQPIGLRLRRRRLFALGGAGARDGTLLLLLDDHRLGAAMAEVLPDVAGFDRPLQAHWLARRCSAQCLLGSLFRLSHARPVFG